MLFVKFFMVIIVLFIVVFCVEILDMVLIIVVKFLFFYNNIKNKIFVDCENDKL